MTVYEYRIVDSVWFGHIQHRFAKRATQPRHARAKAGANYTPFRRQENMTQNVHSETAGAPSQLTPAPYILASTPLFKKSQLQNILTPSHVNSET